MTIKNEQIAKLCMNLMRADTADEVTKLLRAAGYWDDESAWRPINDDENNYSTIGNQQSEGIAALVEKIINGVDARLVDACLRAGIDPESPDAPQSMIAAVAQFFEVGPKNASSAGRISEWEDSEATREGRLLTVSATGQTAKEGKPSITISDQGEGQTPDNVPVTFMSLGKSNKLRIPFVQGKFNMGGTGALLFSGGATGLQLVVTRRDPALLDATATDRDRSWSFTVVRREDPKHGSRSSVYKYLAPVDLPNGSSGRVLAFSKDAWPIFPEADEKIRDAYARESSYGSLVKLYEYEWKGTNSNIIFSGTGLLRQIDIGLPQLALPVRMYECRHGYKGDPQSFSTNVLGVVARLQRDRGNNLEEGSLTLGAGLTLGGTQIPVRIYVFQPNRAGQYRTASQGVLFSVNGQTHGMFPTDFFKRKSVNLEYLADSLLVVVDCSAIEGRTREDMFMNSRDRLRDRPVVQGLTAALQRLLHDDPTLRSISNRRRMHALQHRLMDDKPLVQVLQGIIKSNPMLSRLLLSGLQLSAPFAPTDDTVKPTKPPFRGERFPTYFRHKGRGDGQQIDRTVGLGSRARVTLETDAEDDYFTRVDEPGAWNIYALDAAGNPQTIDWDWNGPKDGVVHLTLSLPSDVSIGDTLRVMVDITDPVRVDAFTNPVVLTVAKPDDYTPPISPRPRPRKKGGDGAQSNQGLALPNVVPVRRDDWESHSFDENSALSVVSGDGSGDFYVNVDNKYLKILQKDSKTAPELLEKQFTYGFVLIGLAILQDAEKHASHDGEPDRDVDREIRETSRAIAPILVPMLQTLGDLSD